jgi:hypothetical protein
VVMHGCVIFLFIGFWRGEESWGQTGQLVALLLFGGVYPAFFFKECALDQRLICRGSGRKVGRLNEVEQRHTDTAFWRGSGDYTTYVKGCCGRGTRRLDKLNLQIRGVRGYWVLRRGAGVARSRGRCTYCTSD